MIDVRIETDSTLARIAERSRRLRPALESAAEDMQALTGHHFDRRGSGRWPLLDPATLIRRRNAGVASTRILEVTGTLRRSLTSTSSDAIRRVSSDELVFGTRVPYATYVAARRPLLPAADRQMGDRFGAVLADHIFGDR